MLIHKVSLQDVIFGLRCALSATTIIGSIFPFRTQIPTVWFIYSDTTCECHITLEVMYFFQQHNATAKIESILCVPYREFFVKIKSRKV